jgi:hypothetical protein
MKKAINLLDDGHGSSKFVRQHHPSRPGHPRTTVTTMTIAITENACMALVKRRSGVITAAPVA